MERIIRLIEKRKEVGKRKSYTKGGDYNDFIEYNRIGNLILDEVCRLYEEGKLGGINVGMCRQEATKGKQFVLTEKGYNRTPDHVKRERKAGEPVKGFETSVPMTWIEKGYVIEK